MKIKIKSNKFQWTKVLESSLNEQKEIESKMGSNSLEDKLNELHETWKNNNNNDNNSNNNKECLNLNNIQCFIKSCDESQKIERYEMLLSFMRNHSQFIQSVSMTASGWFHMFLLLTLLFTLLFIWYLIDILNILLYILIFQVWMINLLN